MNEETKIKIQLARIIQDKMSASYKRIIEFYQDDIQVIDWLIKQAQKVEQLEQEIEDAKFALSVSRRTMDEYADDIRNLEQQLQQAQTENEKLQRKLNSIRFYVENPIPGDKLAEIILQIIDDADHDGI